MYSTVKRQFAAFLSLMFLMQQLIFIPAFATDITGVSGVGNVYDVNPTSMSGQTGFRQYTNFDLTQGDIANLIFKYGANNVARFVNLVDNQININGLVNSMQDGSFYNGHAIFVSPNGMVVGASGVINVGSLTALTPTSTAYNAFKLNMIEDLTSLKDASQGSITINGKIFARGDVNLHAKNITIGSSSTSKDSTGIFAGVSTAAGTEYNAGDYVSSNAQAELLFNTLVKNNISKGAEFGVDNGKIVITAKSGIATDGKNKFTLDADGLKNTLVASATIQDIEDAAATVNIQNATLGAENIEISAVSDALYSATADSIESIFDQLILEDDVDFVQFFTAAYSNFVGARAKAIVNIKDGAVLNALKDIDISSKAVATTQIKTPRATGINYSSINGDPDELLYAVGMETQSEVNVLSGSKITAGEDLNINALSKNSAVVKMNNSGALKELDVIPNMQLSILNFNNKATTKALVNSGAEVKAKNVDVSAVNVTNENIVVKNIGTYSPIAGVGKASVGAGALMKYDTVNTEAKIDTVIDTSSQGNVDVTAQNLYVSTANVASSAKQLKEDKPASSSNKVTTAAKGLKQKYTLLSNPQLTDFIEGDPNNIDASGSLLMNTSTVTATATIGKNADIHADNVAVNANSVNLTVNKASANSGKGETFSPGVAIIVNNQTTNSNASIENGTSTTERAKVVANNNLDVNATTELPLNERTLQLAFDLADTATEVYYGLSADGADQGAWDLSSLSGITDAAGNVIANVKPIKVGIKQAGLTKTLGLEGFLNNYAQSSAASSGGVSLAGSIIYTNVVNNTNATIGNYADVTAKNITINAANDMIYNNAAGVIKSLFNPTGTSGSDAGLGGSVLVTKTTNNARATIDDNAVVKATEDIGLYSGSQQFFVNIVVTGGSAEKAAVVGSILVQEILGETIASIGDSSVEARNITVSAGSGAKVAHSKRAFDAFSQLDEPDDLTVQAYLRAKTKMEANAAKATEVSSMNAEQLQIWNTVDKALWDAQYTVSADEQAAYDTMTAILAKVNASQTLTAAEQTLADTLELTYNADSATAPIYEFKTLNPSTGKIDVDSPSAINDKVSTINIGGALAQQSKKIKSGEGKSSSGVAVGATVIVNQLDRSVSALIKDGAEVTASNNLTVQSNTLNQGINVAVAAAFAGGVSVKKEKQDKANGADQTQNADKNQKANNFGGWLDKIQPILQKLGSKTDTAKTKTASAATPSTQNLDQHGRPKITVDGKEYVTDNNKQYYNQQTGQVLKDSNGNAVKYQGSMGETPQTDDVKTANNNVSAAAAGSVNTQLNKTSVSSKVGNATIKVGKDLNVTANQKSNYIDVSGGVAKAGTVGAGAALNLYLNEGATQALLGDSTTASSSNKLSVEFTGANANILNVKAEDSIENVDVAIGVGVAKNSESDTTTTVSVGGSFNIGVSENTVKSEIADKSTITDTNNQNDIDINVIANNTTKLYKGAGGLGVNVPTSGTTAIGAGLAANINVLDKTTSATVDGATINNSNDINVKANEDTTNPTEKLISVEVAGSVITGGNASYSFAGAIGTDVFLNDVTAAIKNSTISSAHDVSVLAYDSISNANLAGALNFSAASNGVGVGLSAIVSVVNNTISSTIENTEITESNKVSVDSNDKELLRFLAINMGIQTSGGTAINPNAIVNVLVSDVASGIINSNIKDNADTVSVNSIYDTTIEGITGTGSVSFGSGVVAGGNVLSNTLVTTNTAKVESSEITSDGKLTVKADTDEDIDIVPASVSITSSGSAAVAANVAVNVVSNQTTASIDKTTSGSNSKISAGGIEVSATDDTKSRSRGATLAATGGTAAVGGSIIADVYIKDIDAHIDNTEVTNGGDIKVIASAANIFGEETPGSITASALTSKITDGTYNVSSDTDFYNWDITFDVAGGNTAGVSGSLISKTVVNSVDSYIGSNVDIKNAGKIDVLADNNTVAALIAGNVSAGGTAAIGGSVFVNVNTAIVNAGIKNGAKIGSVSKVGAITVEATSEQVYRSIMFIVGGSGTASVNGSLNANIIVNSTNAYIGKGVEIDSNSTIAVNSEDSADIESLNLAVSGSGTAAIGGIVYANVLANKVNSKIGQDENNTKSGSVKADGNITVDAKSNEDFQANVAMVAGSGSASVSGVVISNTMATEVNSGIEETTVTSNNGSTKVTAFNGFNEKHKDQTTGVKGLSANTKLSTGDLTASDLIPLVAVLNIAASGAAAITGSVVANVVVTDVNAYVKDSAISTKNGLTVDADSLMTTYDAVMGVAGSAYASIAATGVVNVYAGSTSAILDNSNVSMGDVTLTSDDTFNLNTIIFSATGAGVGAAVTAVNNTNTIVNDVVAEITNSSLTDQADVEVRATGNVNLNDIIVAGGGVGIGGAVTVVPIVNVFIGNTRASISGSSIDKSAITLYAKNDIDTSSIMIGMTGSGIGADVSGYVATNVFDNDLDAYISNSTITNAQSTSITAESIVDMAGVIVSGGVTGVGASVIVNGIVSVINNNINAYIANSDITGGSVNVEAKQDTTIVDTTASANATGIGDSTALNTIVHVFTNKLNSYIQDTAITNASSITVKATGIQDVNNTNIGISASGTAAVSANALVNVFESEIHSYINSGAEDVSSTGKIDVNATNTLNLYNVVGLMAGSGGIAAGVTADVNIINNSLKSEILSTTGTITGSEVDVTSTSTLGLDIATASAAIGGLGLAGTVAVTSIGDKFDSSDKNSDLKTSDSLTSAKTSADNVMDVSYEKDGSTKSVSDVTLAKGTSTAKEGTVANINANVTATGANGIEVNATNTLKGYSSDTAKITNANIAAGVYAAGASVLVTDMKYNTSAGISGGNVNANNGNIQVKADNTVKANTNSIAATVAAVGIAGNASYFKNSAITEAEIADATIYSSSKISVISNSIDNIVTKAVSGTAGLATIAINVAIAETNNNTKANITGDVDITASDLDVTSSLSSYLESELFALQVSGISVGAVVNRTKSSAVVDAIVDATGDIKVDDEMNVIAYNKGISAKSKMYAGTLAFYSGSVSAQGATIDADFNAKIDNSDLNVASSTGGYSNKISVLSGVNTDNTTAGTLTTEITSLSASAGLASANATYQNATVSSDSNAKVNAKTLKTKELNVASKLTRTARTGSSSATLGGVTFGALQLNSVINGTSNIELGGNLAVQNALNIVLNDTANATSKMLSASLSIGSVAANQIIADIDTDTTITLGGIINAGIMDIDSAVYRNSYSTAKSDSYGLVSINLMSMRSKTLGDSTINYNATSNTSGFANTIDINSVATNTTQSYMSDHSAALAALARGSTTNTLNTNNTVKFVNANITSTGDVKASVENNNQLAMTKDSSSSGFIVIKGGSLNNNVTSNSKIEIDNSVINARDISMTSKTTIGNVAGTAMYYDDDSSGFITSSGANLSNSVSQSNLIDIKGGSKLTASRNLILSTIANATFAQYVMSDSSGAGCYNEANSYLTVNNDSDINITGTGTAVTAAVNANIAMDSNNTLSSQAKVEAHHFAGQPGAESRLTANIYNDFTVGTGSSFNAGENINVNFMANSVNRLTQYAYAYAEAAVASADYSGGIVFNNKNTMTVNSGGLVSSLKNVFLNYKNGNNTLNSKIAYKKVSRLLFGIPITKSGSWSNVTSTSLNKLVNNGTIEAGRAGQRKLYINPDGSVNEAESSGFTSADYTKTSSTGLTSEEATQQAKDDINANIEAINAKLAELDADETKNDEAIAEFTLLRNQYQAALNALNASGTMTVAEVNAAMADVIDNYAYNADATHAYVGSSEYYGSGDGGGLKSKTEYSNNTHIDSSTFTTLWNQILAADTDSDDATTIDTVLAAYNYNATYTVTTTNYKTDGSVDSTSSSTQTMARGLNSTQISAIRNAWSGEKAKILADQQVATSDISLSTYNGKYIFTDDTEKTDTFTNINSSISSYNGFITDLDTLNSDIDSSRVTYNANKSSLAAEISNLTLNPLPAVTVSDPTYVFKNITMEPAKIQITGLQSLAGSGEFKTYDRGLTIDNYSNYNLVFNNIIFDTSGTGLTINGTAYNNPGKVAWGGASHNVQRVYDTTGDGNIHISTYFDHNNPLDLISSTADITLNGYIRNTVADKYLDVFNDSGNIVFNDVVDTVERNIIASQGNIEFNKAAGNVSLRSDGHIIAGQDISIKAKTLTNNGVIKAGNADRNIVIDDTLYNSLTLDSNDVNNMSKTLKSTYLNSSNNIKAIRDTDGNIHIYNTDATSGSITVNATTKNGSGTYTYSDGYGTVSITNNTNHKVIVHNLTNNYEAGTISGVSGTKLASTSASTTITSNDAEVELKELLSSGNNGVGDTGLGTVTITAKAVSIPNRIVSAAQQPTVDVTGTYTSTSTNGTNVLGFIKNRKGNTTIANNTAGDLTIGATGKVQNQNGALTLTNSGTGKLETVAGSTLTNVGTFAITNNGAGGAQIGGSATNTGATNITNTSGLLNLASTGTVTNSTGNITVTNSGSKVQIAGTLTNNVSGNTTITNSGANGVEISGTVTNANGTTDINNNSTETTSGIKIASTGKVENTGGALTIDNKGGKLLVEKNSGVIGLVKNTNGDISLKNTGEGIEIQGDVQNLTPSGTARALAITNTGGSDGILVSGNVTNAKGSTTLTNTAGDLSIASTGLVSNSTGTLTLDNSGTGAIKIAGATNNNVSGNTVITNAGDSGIDISGRVINANGLVNVNNTNTTSTSGINLTTTGLISNTTGNIIVQNKGALGIIVQGIIQAINNDISLIADNSDITIGEYASTNDNYVNAQNGNITITIDTGNLLNGIVDPDTTTQNASQNLASLDSAYKTLLKSARNLTIDVEDGDIGYTANAKPGFSVNASTRDYTESVNVNVGGTITASATNDSLSTERLINIRSKDSDMKVNSITADGNIMLTAADWKQVDVNPAPVDTAYYKGYSILNANTDKTQPNVKGKNISIITSDRLGEAGNAFNYEQTDIGVNSWLSFEAENDVNINNTGTLGSNIWQAISKNGSMKLVLNGDNTTIRTITAGKNLHITDKGKNLTIYNLGLIDTIGNDLDDMLYPHDRITLQGATGRAVPETVRIEVLDANGGDNPNSTLNIFNAFVKGIGSSTQSDVIIRSDNFIAHAYDAPGSYISTVSRPSFNYTTEEKAERLYSNNPLDTTATKDLEATGFHSYGNGGMLNFDLRGVYPSLVEQYTGSSLTRTYYEQPIITTLIVFTNPLYIPGTDYKMKDATLSYNQDDASLENRGLALQHLYANNSYINSNDLNFDIKDAIITNYAEFRNGNRSVVPHDGREDYRWKTIVDNDYRRLLILDTYVTLQLYTALTGSFGLEMGDLIVMQTMAPPVHYNPYEVTNLPRNENSFYRQTYKDDKIQEKTTTPEFKDIDKATDSHTKRESIRFDSQQISVSAKDSSAQVFNISKTGMELENTTNAKVGDVIPLDIKIGNVNIKTEGQVMRAVDGKIGVKFINLDKATANKILYLNMLSTAGGSSRISSK